MSLFCGNLAFASLDVLSFNRPSRKDDLIMVCYFMIFLLNGAEIPFLYDFMENLPSEDSQIEIIKKFKKKFNFDKLIEGLKHD